MENCPKLVDIQMTEAQICKANAMKCETPEIS